MFIMTTALLKSFGLNAFRPHEMAAFSNSSGLKKAPFSVQIKLCFHLCSVNGASAKFLEHYFNYHGDRPPIKC